MGRYAEVTRKTGETDIVVKLDLDGSGVCDISTGVPCRRLRQVQGDTVQPCRRNAPCHGVQACSSTSLTG